MGQRLVTIDGLSFNLDDLIGEGSFGAVYKGTYVSIKVVVKRVLTNEEDADAAILHTKAHQDGFHANIIIYNCVKQDGHFISVISELCVGTLHDIVCGGYPMLNDNRMAMLQQITLALEDLHTNGIIHRDLKPSNILVLISSGTGLAVWKLADYGIFRIVQGEKSKHTLVKGRSKLFRAAGIKGWIAPEMLLSNMSFPVDIYVLGITLAFSLTGNHPFGSDRLNRLVHMEEGKPIIKSVQEQLQELNPAILILNQRMLKVNPNERPTATEVLANAIFQPMVVKIENAALDETEPVPSTSTMSTIYTTISNESSAFSSNETVTLSGSQSCALDCHGATIAEALYDKQVLEQELLELCRFDSSTETGLAKSSELVAHKTVDINYSDANCKLNPTIVFLLE